MMGTFSSGADFHTNHSQMVQRFLMQTSYLHDSPEVGRCYREQN